MSQFFKKKRESIELHELDHSGDQDEEEDEEDIKTKHPLSFYRTNDVMWYEPPLTEKSKVNVKLLLFMASFFGALIIIVTVTIYTIQARKDFKIYDHDKVRLVPIKGTVQTRNPTCQFIRNCTVACQGNIELEHEIGCCMGCGLNTDCNFDIQVIWQAVEEKPAPQRVWIFVSTNGEGFFQTGFAPYITNTSGQAVVGNGCFSAPNQQIILIACLSTNKLQDRSYEGFPADSCDSSFGICIATNGVYNEELEECSNGYWKANNYKTSWDGPKFNGGFLLQPSSLLTVVASALILLANFK